MLMLINHINPIFCAPSFAHDLNYWICSSSSSLIGMYCYSHFVDCYIQFYLIRCLYMWVYHSVDICSPNTDAW